MSQLSDEEKIDEKAKKILRLLDNDDFVDIIMDEYLGSDIHDLVMEEDVKKEAIQEELISRRTLRLYLYDILRQAELLKQEKI